MRNGSFESNRQDRSRGKSNFLTSLSAVTQGAAHLPTWPFTMIFFAYPIWWILGLSDLIWLAAAAIMGLYLTRFRAVQVPRGFGVWLLFLVWMTFSIIQIDSPDRLMGFFYRCLIYYSVTVIFLYVYNSKSLTGKKVLGALTSFWAFVIVGGYLGLLFPTVVIKTPLSYILPSGALQNELINQMAIRRLTQFNPTAWLPQDPRPTAPFLYTNNWGAAYSLLLPLIVVYLWQIRGQRRFWLVAAAIPISIVPAVLTLNRGMFLGIGISILYIGVRFALSGNKRGIATVLGFTAMALAVVRFLPITERLNNRLGSSSTTEDRQNLYVEAFRDTLNSPFFGYGGPRPSTTIGAPSVGTQGQFWMVLYSHGFIGVALFTLAIVVLFFSTLRRMNPLVLACNSILLVSLVEIFYYGMLTTGLVLIMVAAAVALKEPEINRDLPAPDLEASHQT